MVSVKRVFPVDFFRSNVFGHEPSGWNLDPDGDRVRFACPDLKRCRNRAVMVDQAGGRFVFSCVQIILCAVVEYPVVRTVNLRLFLTVFLEITVREQFTDDFHLIDEQPVPFFGIL